MTAGEGVGVRIRAASRRVAQGGSIEAQRPVSLPARGWRRMSHLSRLVAMVAAEALERAPEVDRAGLATVWASAYGEIATTSRFLDRMYREGPAVVSPTAFQTSVYGTPLGHLSIALGLTGPSETLSAMGASSAMALMRGIDLIRAGRAPAALVLAGDELCETVTHAAALAGGPSPLTEAVAAVILAPGEPGPLVEVVAGGVPADPEPFACPGGGLARVVGLLDGGGEVVERDGPATWTIRVGG